MSQSFRFDWQSLSRGVAAIPERADKALMAYGEIAAVRMAGRMRERAPWQNRTGQARQRLNSHCERIENGYRIALYHGVYYGVYLEYAMEKRFAIIEPTINTMGINEVLPAWQRVAFNVLSR